jgi:two-component system NtrC family sensor kinase
MAKARSGAGTNEDARREADYRRLFRRFIFLAVVSSIIPLLLIGWIINYYYSDFAGNRTSDSFQTQLEQHRKLVEMFLQEQVSKLNLVAQVNTREFLADEANLLKAFENINEGRGAFTDLGLIDRNGSHLAYIGPFDLIKENYAPSFWFQEITLLPYSDVRGTKSGS